MNKQASSASLAESAKPLSVIESGAAVEIGTHQTGKANISQLQEVRRRKIGRRASVDILRGFTVFSMLLVNNKAANSILPQQLYHASWSQRIHFADMVFPFFVFLMGVAIPFSGRAARNDPKKFYFETLRRALTLVFLGCVINSSYMRRMMFDFGILQIIGLSYFFASLAGTWSLRNRLIAAGALLVSHWAAMRFFPVPGVGVGVIEQQRNFIVYMNHSLLGRFGLEGALSVVNATALALIGTGVGDLLRREKKPTARGSLILAAVGVAMILGGWLWSLDLRFSKPLWTASYVVFSAGWASLALALFHYVADVRGIRGWAFPFVVFSANAIVVFVAPILVNVHILREWMWRLPDGSNMPLQQFMQASMIDHFGRLVGGWMYLALFVGFWWAVLYRMYQKKIFVKV